jgi:hypothetical protein
VHTYKIYGLKVFSDFKLKGLEKIDCKKGSEKNTDVEILNEVSGRLYTQKSSKKIKGYFPNLLEFVICDGSKVYIDSTSGADEDEIATAILGDIMAILLRQRGLYVLHACCLSINGRAFSLVGDSGAGKSTTAYFLARNAWNLLSDDITAIDMKPDGLHVIPGPPRVKLKPEVGTQFVNDFESKKKVHQRSEKRYVYLERSNEPSVLNKIYILKRGKKTCIEDIKPRGALVSILKNTRGSRVLTDNKHASNSLKGSETLCSKADVKVLKTNRNIEGNKKIDKIIKKDMSLK